MENFRLDYDPDIAPRCYLRNSSSLFLTELSPLVLCFSVKLDAEHSVFAVTEAHLNAFSASDHQTGTTIL